MHIDYRRMCVCVHIYYIILYYVMLCYVILYISLSLLSLSLMGVELNMMGFKLYIYSWDSINHPKVSQEGL
jgi:hypothetical protein